MLNVGCWMEQCECLPAFLARRSAALNKNGQAARSPLCASLFQGGTGGPPVILLNKWTPTHP